MRAMANVCRAEPLRRLLCSGPARGFLDPERAPVPARAPEALHSLAAEASEASARVGVLGVPLDDNSSFMRGPALAPRAIRLALHSDSANSWSEAPVAVRPRSAAQRSQRHARHGYDMSAGPGVWDAGDLILPDAGAEHGKVPGGAGHARMSAVSDGVRALARAGLKPLVLGGDHSLTYPILRGIQHSNAVNGDETGKGGMLYSDLTILHFDAHSDMYGYDVAGGDNRYSHASPFARILEDGLAQRVHQIGVRTMTAHLWQQQDTLNPDGQVFTMQEVFLQGAAQVVRELGARLGRRAGAEREGRGRGRTGLYISVDLDCLDPAFAPGVSHYEPGGMSTRELLYCIQATFPETPVVGADLVEMNPLRDPCYQVPTVLGRAPVGPTAMVAAKVAKELVSRLLGSREHEGGGSCKEGE